MVPTGDDRARSKLDREANLGRPGMKRNSGFDLPSIVVNQSLTLLLILLAIWTRWSLRKLHVDYQNPTAAVV